MTQSDLLTNIEQTFANCLSIVRRKNADYAGSDNAFKNFQYSELVGVEIRRAVLVRMTDKLARISNLLDKEPAVVNESLSDSLEDLINYAAILKAMCQEHD